MQDGSARSDAEENFGSLIRASIDIDAWISNGRAQLDAQEYGLVPARDSNVSHLQEDERLNVAEGISYSQLESWSLESRKKEVSEMGKWENSVSFVQPERKRRNDAYDDSNHVQKPRLREPDNPADEFFEENEVPVREKTPGNYVTLEKTPEQTRYEDVFKNLNGIDSAVKNFGAFSFSQDHESFGKLPSFEEAFGKNLTNPCIEVLEGLRVRRDDDEFRVTTARKTINCYKCREVIEPGDWIRSVPTGSDFDDFYHTNCFHCDYCKGVISTDQYYTFHQGKLMCNFDFQMLTNLRKVTNKSKKRLVVLHSVKKGAKKSVRISLEQGEILQQAFRSKDVPHTIVNKSH